MAKVREARIHGTWVTWVQGSPPAVMLYNVNWEGTSLVPFQISNIAPAPGEDPPPATQVEIGSDFVVWEESGASPHEVRAWELISNSPHLVSGGGDSRNPATAGSVVVWEERTPSGTEIRGRDMQSKTNFTIAAGVDPSAPLDFINPSVYVDSAGSGLVGYESEGSVLVYRFSDWDVANGNTFQVSAASSSQFLNDVHDDLVAYLDDRNAGTGDVFVSHLEFPDCPP
jgi:hypothetical protein